MIISCESCQTKFQLERSILKSKGSQVRCSKCHTVFVVYPPDTRDRRKHRRIRTFSLISHFSVDQNDKIIAQGLSKALDISRGGILLETSEPIETGIISLTAMDKDSNLIEVKGKLIYSKKDASGLYHAGIEFMGSDLQVENFVRKLIKEYYYRKKCLYFSEAS